ncbi:MAG: hypothetical protein FWF57_09110 [Defluviitaleaceae bacterium]|nr:hypothetical protein [Defluviitaleaceae bacterium]
MNRLKDEENSNLILLIDDYNNNTFNPTNILRTVSSYFEGNFFGIEIGKTHIQQIIDILGEPDFFGIIEKWEKVVILFHIGLNLPH